MARRPKEISIYERINEIQIQITKEKEILNELNSQLEELLKEKDMFEMNQVWSLMKENNLTLEDVQAMISNK